MSNFTPEKREVDEFGYICADKAVIAKALVKPEAVLGDYCRLRVGKSVLSPVYMENILGYSCEEWLKSLMLTPDLWPPPLICTLSLGLLPKTLTIAKLT